jgi:hypothetical protein
MQDSTVALDSGTQPASAPLPPGEWNPPAPDETLVADPRAGLTPSQLVERKLVTLLGASSLPVSTLQTARLTRR